MLSCIIRGTGSFLPTTIRTNEDLARMVDTSDAWIRERTGIVQRHILEAEKSTSHMATEAASRAIAASGLSATDIDAIVVATSTSDTTMPSVATRVQQALGFSGPALDVAAACTGFVYALSVAQGWLQAGIAKNALVIGAETMSRIVDWTDRNTCILFGDGAGAVVLSAEKNNEGRGLLATKLYANGAFGPLLGTNGGTATTQTAGHMFMAGPEIFKHGVEKMAAATRETVAQAGYKISDLDWLVPHQANARMITTIGKQLSVPSEKCVITVDRHGNTSAASIPLALDVLVTDKKLYPGHLVAMPALGAGLSWGCSLIRW